MAVPFERRTTQRNAISGATHRDGVIFAPTDVVLTSSNAESMTYRPPFRKALQIVLFSAFSVSIPSAWVAAQSQTAPTRVTVRVVSHDAKIIGDGVGGVRVVITRAADGHILADGMQTGSTGDTNAIMVQPRERGQKTFNTPGAAAFHAELALIEPTLVDITAYGPLGDPGHLVQTGRRMLLVPGFHVEGEGIILEMNGFTVRVLSPRAEKVERAHSDITVTTSVTMLCGCPTEPDGLWDNNRYTIMGKLYRDDELLGETTLAYAGQSNMYSGVFRGVAEGRYRVEVIAADAEKGNFGYDHVRFSVSE